MERLIYKYLQEPEVDEDNDDKKVSLLKMDFPLNLVDFALDKLGGLIISFIFLFLFVIKRLPFLFDFSIR